MWTEALLRWQQPFWNAASFHLFVYLFVYWKESLSGLCLLLHTENGIFWKNWAYHGLITLGFFLFVCFEMSMEIPQTGCVWMFFIQPMKKQEINTQISQLTAPDTGGISLVQGCSVTFHFGEMSVFYKCNRTHQYLGPLIKPWNCVGVFSLLNFWSASCSILCWHFCNKVALGSCSLRDFFISAGTDLDTSRYLS